MFAAFQKYIKSENLFTGQDAILLTVSGGLDSVTMLSLFCRLKADVSEYRNVKLAIAHCNFGLRGAESEGDALFVRNLATQNNLPLFAKKFETANFAKQEKSSIQMAARKLRYEWFETLRMQEGFQYIATAHHQNDVTETIIMNLVKGTGIAGLHGIAPKSGFVLRPLLFATREVLTAYSQEHQISFREDSSNTSTKYIRNKIRKEIIPVLNELNPGLEQTFRENIAKIKAVEAIYRHYIMEKRQSLFVEKDDQIHIAIAQLKALPEPSIILYELLKPFSFPATVAKDIASKWDGLSGKQYYSPTHRLLKDRDKLIITSIKKSENEYYLISEDQNQAYAPLPLFFNKEKRTDISNLQIGQTAALLDLSKIVYPLTLRRWQVGDAFQPLGMKQNKKISDYLIDNKVDRIAKENTWVILSGNDIVWLVGHRPHERYKVTDRTENVLRIRLGD